MKLLLLVLTLSTIESMAFASTRVRGYTKRNGTYVEPHNRSSPDGSSYNNWSTKGNVNPYTGKIGTKNP